MKRILILTAAFGEGHNAAARGLRAAFEEIGSGEAEAEVVDIFASSYPRIYRAAQRGYLGLINRIPRLWGKVYDWIDAADTNSIELPSLPRAERALAQLIKERQPSAIISVYPAYGYLLDHIFPDGRPCPLLTVITDSISVNSVWYRCGSDFFIAINDDTARVLVAEGIAAAKIKTLGFPVATVFGRNPHTRPPLSSSRKPRVLYLINTGKAAAPQLIEKLLAETDAQFTVAAGRDDALLDQVREIVRGSGKTAEILGWTDRLPQVLMEQHLVITKAGGASVQEAIAACTPIIISQVVPGQEQGNARLILDNDCGIVAEQAEEIVEAINGAFADEGAVWNRWHGNISRLSRPTAAHDIARFVLALAGESPGDSAASAG